MELERRRMNQEVAHYRARNNPSLAEWCLVAAPVGGAITALALGSVIGAILCGIATVALGVAVVRRHPMAGPALAEFDIKDYPPSYKYSWIFPFLPSFPLASLVPHMDLHVPDLLAASAGGLYVAGISALSFWLAVRRTRMVAQRRIRRLTAGGELEGITAARLELVDAHRAIVAALLAVGAVGGGQIRASVLAKLMDTTPEHNVDSLQELEAAGIVDVSRIGLYADVPQWRITLTDLGIRAAHSNR